VSFTFGGVQFPVHPLDMSDYSPNDVTHNRCIGSMQYTAGLNAGDVWVSGSSGYLDVLSLTFSVGLDTQDPGKQLLEECVRQSLSALSYMSTRC
jgi:hypothetical protein